MSQLKATVERDAAVAAIARAQAVVARQTTIPILQDLLIETTAEGLRLRATDLDMEVVVELPAQVEAPGRLTASAVRLNDIFRNLPSGAEVALTQQAAPARLLVRCGRSRFQAPTLDPGDFPVMETGEGGVAAEFSARDLARMVDKAAFAICTDATRYYLGGLHLHWERGRLVAAATDSHRLARVEAQAPDIWETAPAITVPRRAVGEIRRILGTLAGDVEIWTNGRLFRVTAGSTVLTTKVLDGSFPDYRRVIPADNPWRLEADAEDLTVGLKRVSVATVDKSRPIQMALSAEGLVLTARDGQGGEAEEAMPADYSGEAQTLGFNSTYLREMVAQIVGEKVVMELGGPGDPVKAFDPNDAQSIFVVMPLRV
jgi:DNA polymerase-3 subunit beta